MHPTVISLYKNLAVVFAAVSVGYTTGHLLERHEDERMTKFRDKSALYGKTLKPGQPPSWP